MTAVLVLSGTIKVGAPPVKFQGVDVRLDPSLQLLIASRFRVGVRTGPQHRNKQRCRPRLPRRGVIDGDRCPRPVHEHLLPGFVFLTQHYIQVPPPVLIALAKPTVAISLRMRLTVFFPRQTNSNRNRRTFFVFRMDFLLAGTLSSFVYGVSMPADCPASLHLLLFVCGKHSAPSRTPIR